MPAHRALAKRGHPIWHWLLLAALSCLSASLQAATPAAPTQLEPLPDWVEPVDVQPQWDATDQQDAGWRYWLVDTQQDTRGGDAAGYYDYAYEALTPERLGDAGRYEINFRAEYQRIALHRVEVRRGGRWESRFQPDTLQMVQRQSEFEADTDDQGWSLLIVLDDVRVGDVVRISYTVHGRNPVLAGLVHKEFSFSAGVPIAHRKVRMLMDPGSDLDARAVNSPPPAQLESRTDALIWSAEARHVAATPAESDTPEKVTDRPTWMLGLRRSWADVAQWALPLYSQPGELPADLQARLQAVRAKPASERAAWALALVQDEVRYHLVVLGDSSHRPHPVQTVWTRRMGDCKDKSVLLTTLLRALDIEASPALVSVSLQEAIDERPPAATVFDHVIVRARIDGQAYWLDPTLTLQRGPLSGRRAGAYGQALVIEPATRTLTPMPAAIASADRTEIEERFRVVADAPKAIELKVTTRYEGLAADRFRRSYASAGTDATSQRYLSYYRSHYQQAERAQPLQVDDDETHNRILVHEHYRLPEPWQLSDAGQQLGLTAGQLLDALNEPTPGERKFPFVAASVAEWHYRAVLDLPPDWEPAGSADARKVSSAAFDWQTRQRLGASQWTIEHHLLGKRAIIGPEAVSEHYEAVRRARALADWEFSVRPPAVQRIESREQRLRAILDSLPVR